LADPAYPTGSNHRFFVNGTPAIADFYNGSSWRTILVGTTAAGGRGVFGLDITDPSSFDATKVLWDKDNTDDSDIGYTIGTPQIGRIPNGDWVAIMGNGYESTSKKAILLVINLSTGAISKIDTGVGDAVTPANANGLSTPRLIRDNTYTIIGAYAGDLQGNMWKFNFAKTGSNSGGSVAFSGKPLYTAINIEKQIQPITVQPEIYPHPLGGLIISFGTGKLFETDNETIADKQYIYGVWDRTGATKDTLGTVSFNDLQEQTLTVLQDGNSYSLSQNKIDWSAKRGWYINLKLNSAERIVIDPEVVYTALAYTSIIPGGSSDPCISDGFSTTYYIDPVTGGSLSVNVFDKIGNQNVVAAEARVSGKRSVLTFGSTILRKKAELSASKRLLTVKFWVEIMLKMINHHIHQLGVCGVKY